MAMASRKKMQNPWDSLHGTADVEVEPVNAAIPKWKEPDGASAVLQRSKGPSIDKAEPGGRSLPYKLGLLT
jgi:hypothetical protein